jgi:hypothetical protein
MRPQYLKVNPVDGDTLEGEPIDPQTKQSPGNIMNVILTAACFSACFIIGGAGGWCGHWLLNPHNFSEAQQELISKGYADAAEHLGEIEKACPNGSGTKIACRLLLLNGEEIAGRESAPQLSQR